MDDSGPPVVHYGMHVPAATSTPMHTEVHTQGSQQEDSYQQIIPGIPQGSLYPTLSSLSSKVITPQEAQTLHDKVSKDLEKYLQDAKQCQALEVNYFDDNSTHQREEPNPETAEQTVQPLHFNIRFNIDLTTFPTLWAVLSTLLKTQDVTHEHVKCLQEEYDTYYADKPKDYILKLERQSVELQNRMYDSVTHNFDRVSGIHDKGSTPLLRQEGDQSDEVTTPENATDDDDIDIRTLYPSWPSDINDMNDINQMTNYKSMTNIRDKIGKDTPLKTDINKPYIDNIDAYDRDRHLITVSLSDRLDLGQNSLLGAQQVRAVVKHTDRISEFPEHLS